VVQEDGAALTDAIAVGDGAVRDRALDERCVFPADEGRVLTAQALLAELPGLPPGPTGTPEVGG
jgi:hypothetical protein